MALIQNATSLRDGVYIFNVFSPTVDIAAHGLFTSDELQFSNLEALLNYMRSIEFTFNSMDHTDGGWISLYCFEGEIFSVEDLMQFPNEFGNSFSEFTIRPIAV